MTTTVHLTPEKTALRTPDGDITVPVQITLPDGSTTTGTLTMPRRQAGRLADRLTYLVTHPHTPVGNPYALEALRIPR